MWCIGKLDAEYRERMYHLIDLYEKEYDRKRPTVCVDEKSKQLLGTPRGQINGKDGTKTDYEYERNGTRNIFLAVEPKGGKRRVEVTTYRKKADFAAFVRALADEEYPEAEEIDIVLDNLNTHFKKSFFETFDETEAKRILSKIRFHYTPKHARWLNMAEMEIGIMDRQCLNRRIPTEQLLCSELSAWETGRNNALAKLVWKFSKQDADDKLSRHYI